MKVEEKEGRGKESERGTLALKCSRCSSNPVHHACVAGSSLVNVWRILCQCSRPRSASLLCLEVCCEINHHARPGSAGARAPPHRWGSRGSASTIGEGARARNVEGGASAGTFGEGAGARNVEGGASASLAAQSAKEPVWGVRRDEQSICQHAR